MRLPGVVTQNRLLDGFDPDSDGVLSGRSIRPKNYSEPEYAALSCGTAYAGSSTHHFGDLLGNGQAQASSAVLAVVVELSACSKAPKSLGRTSGEMPIPVSSTSKRKVMVSSARASSLHSQGNVAGLGELDGIGRIVEQGLLQPGGIAVQGMGQRRGFYMQAQPLVFGLLAKHRGDIAK